MKVRTLLFIGIFMVSSACAQSCGESAYRNEVREQVEPLVFTASPKDLWAETRSILKESGYAFPKGNAPIKKSAIAAWKGEEGNRSHYSVRIIKASKGHNLHIHRIDENNVPTYAEGAFDDPDAGEPVPTGHELKTSRQRDLDIEWEVVQRLEPAQAAGINKDAQEREEKVRDVVASGCQ